MVRSLNSIKSLNLLKTQHENKKYLSKTKHVQLLLSCHHLQSLINMEQWGKKTVLEDKLSSEGL